MARKQALPIDELLTPSQGRGSSSSRFHNRNPLLSPMFFSGRKVSDRQPLAAQGCWQWT